MYDISIAVFKTESYDISVWGDHQISAKSVQILNKKHDFNLNFHVKYHSKNV